jgi:hypothetical protein
MSDAPLTFAWDGDAMIPVMSCRRAANERYVIGERYQMTVVEARSQRSHNHYFAALHEAWLNLPDHLAVQYGSPEHLRKAALIATGHYEERRFAASSPAEARKLVAFLRPMDEFAVYAVAGNVVIERKAKSQSRKAMGGPTFQKSKDDVLGWCADLIEVTTFALNTAEAA